MDKVKRTKEQIMTYKTLGRRLTIDEHEIPLNTGGELLFSARVSSSFSTSDTRRVNLVTKMNTVGYSSMSGYRRYEEILYV